MSNVSHNFSDTHARYIVHREAINETQYLQGIHIMDHTLWLSDFER